MRSTDEWIGKTDDTAIPPRVRLRVWERCGGICALTGRKIMPGEMWDLDHIRALVNGGAHRETNLQVVLREPHRKKTVEDVAEKSKTYRMAAKNAGTWPKSRFPIKGRGFPKSRRRQAIETGGEREP